MKLVLLRIFFSTLSLLCPRFLGIPSSIRRNQEELTCTARTCLHTHTSPAMVPFAPWGAQLSAPSFDLARAELPEKCELSHYCQAAPGESGAHVFVGQLVPVRHNVKQKH